MIFNLNEFLMSIANALDAIEIDIFGMPTNHSKRIAYISVILARELRFSDEEIFDLASLSIMHDNGASMKILNDNLNATAKEKINISESKKEHCTIGEDNIRNFPFMTSPQNIIKYHHEKCDGSGFFGLTESEIPLFAQIIALADTLDLNFDLRHVGNKNKFIAFVDDHRNTYFSIPLSDIFIKISDDEFWDSLTDDNIDDKLMEVIPKFNNELDFKQIRAITKTFSKIIDAKSKFTRSHSSGLSDKLKIMAEYYGIDSEITLKLLIAGDLHDLGKLVINNRILDKPGKLTNEEIIEMMTHPVITKECLQFITGFEDITKWASNHHEKLDGSGYPEGLTAKNLDFNSRLLACLDIYQALREERPYLEAMDHKQAMNILNDMSEKGKLDYNIVRNINTVFQY